MRMKSNPFWIVGISIIVVFGIIFFSYSTIEDKVSETESISPFVTTNVEPSVYTIIPEHEKIDVSISVVTPEISKIDSVTLTNYQSATAKLVFPFIQSAFAIPSSALTVTLDEWTIPTARSNPFVVTVDSTDNVYFAEVTGNKIGRLVPSTNVITEWTIPTAGLNLFGVTVDSTDNVFFTVTGSVNKIGRLVPSTNVVTEWTIPTANSNPQGVTVDSTGNVYFTESAVNKIGRLVPSTNVITEWTIPTANSNPQGVTVDSTDNVYFAEVKANKIGRLS